MLAEEQLRAGNLKATLEALQGQVRGSPADLKLRVFMFQLLVLMGEWERALKQLQVAATLDVEATSLAQAYRELIRCELFRAEVFQGKRAPVLLGDPMPWHAMMIQALAHTAAGRHELAEQLRAEALETASAVAGTADGEPFSWVADCDSRLGPMLEVVACGRYCWLPFERLQSLEVSPPVDLRDLVWIPAKLGLAEGEELDCFIPTRYPGSELGDDSLRLARRTEWLELGAATACGLGQRMFVTDTSELSLLELRRLTFGAQQQPSIVASAAANPSPDG